MSGLVPCASCDRHVRASESTCPFCGQPRGDGAPRALAPLPAERSLTRAAVMLMGATAVAACGKTNAPNEPPPPTPPISTEQAAPAYGPPPVMPSTEPVAVMDAGQPPPRPQTNAAPAYGPPPIKPKPAKP